MINIGVYTVLIDPETEQNLLINNNRLVIRKSRGVPYCFVYKTGRSIPLHRYIMNVENQSVRITAIDGDFLNCQKSNLRIADNKLAQKEWYQNNKELIIERSKLWYENHKQHRQNYIKKYQAEHRGKVKTWRKKHRQKEHIKFKYNTYYIGKSRDIKYRHRYTRNKALNENRIFDISLEEYTKLIESPCYYCMKSLSGEMGKGLDRIDNDGGYQITNVLPCCGSCNKTKGDRFTVEETKVMIAALLNFRMEQKKDE